MQKQFQARDTHRMIKNNGRHRKTARLGGTMVEYGILVGLLGVICIEGYMALGQPLQEMLTNVGTHTQSKNTLTLLDIHPNGASGPNGTTASSNFAVLKGKGYYNLAIDPATGRPQLKVVDGENGVSVNVSSVDGSTGRYNALGSVMLAKKIDKLAEQQTDPDLKSYFQQLAKYSYYLGGAEGAMDNVPRLSNGDLMASRVDGATGKMNTYTLGDGLHDVFNYHTQLQALLKNPPAGVNAQDLTQVMPYALDVSNIAQNYLNNFAKFIEPDGSVPNNFGNPDQCTTKPPYGCGAGLGPGASLAYADTVTAESPYLHQMSNIAYDQLMDLDTLKTRADLVLADNRVTNVPVTTTLKDSKTIDVAAK